MESSPTEAAERKFRDYLASKGLRTTQERFAILRKSLGYEGHFDADRLHADLEGEGYHVSRATVYNTLELLCKCMVLTRLHLNPRQACYERADRSHCHLVCTQCGKVKELNADESLGRLLGMKMPSFSPQAAAVSIYGLCSTCLRRNRQEAKRQKMQSQSNK